MSKYTTEQLRDWHRDLWRWLSEHPEKEKREWPGWTEMAMVKDEHRPSIWAGRGGTYTIRIPLIPNYCFACEVAGFPTDRILPGEDRNANMRAACAKCPIDWGVLDEDGVCHCEAKTSPYADWDEADEPEERVRLALLIRDLWPHEEEGVGECGTC